MADIKFTEKNPPAGIPARHDIYRDVKSSDLVSDPMSVTMDVTGYDDDGNPTVNEVVTQYDKADYDGVTL